MLMLVLVSYSHIFIILQVDPTNLEELLFSHPEILEFVVIDIN